MSLMSRAFPALSFAQCWELGRRWRWTTRTPWARLSPFRRAVDYLRSCISIRLEPHHSGAESTLRAEILSYFFFLLLVGMTFLV